MRAKKCKKSSSKAERDKLFPTEIKQPQLRSPTLSSQSKGEMTSSSNSWTSHSDWDERITKLNSTAQEDLTDSRKRKNRENVNGRRQGCSGQRPGLGWGSAPPRLIWIVAHKCTVLHGVASNGWPSKGIPSACGKVFSFCQKRTSYQEVRVIHGMFTSPFVSPLHVLVADLTYSPTWPSQGCGLFS